MSKVWFITGAGRGMGVDIAKAALAAGHAVVATGRNTAAVSEALGKADNQATVIVQTSSLSKKPQSENWGKRHSTRPLI